MGLQTKVKYENSQKENKKQKGKTNFVKNL